LEWLTATATKEIHHQKFSALIFYKWKKRKKINRCEFLGLIILIYMFSLFKKLAIFAAILCILFMLATIALAITLGMKMRSFQDIDDNIPDIVPSPLLEVS
jgi:hypothetical protein